MTNERTPFYEARVLEEDPPYVKVEFKRGSRIATLWRRIDRRPIRYARHKKRVGLFKSPEISETVTLYSKTKPEPPNLLLDFFISLGKMFLVSLAVVSLLRALSFLIQH